MEDTVLIHMVEETARHAGHADIVRELLDGVAGDHPDRAGIEKRRTSADL